MKALRYVGKKGCGDLAYADEMQEASEDLVILDLVSKRPNIVLRATIDQQRLYLRTSSDIRDFRDITVMSYILDTLALQGRRRLLEPRVRLYVPGAKRSALES